MATPPRLFETHFDDPRIELLSKAMGVGPQGYVYIPQDEWIELRRALAAGEVQVPGWTIGELGRVFVRKLIETTPGLKQLAEIQSEFRRDRQLFSAQKRAYMRLPAWYLEWEIRSQMPEWRDQTQDSLEDLSRLLSLLEKQNVPLGQDITDIDQLNGIHLDSPTRALLVDHFEHKGRLRFTALPNITSGVFGNADNQSHLFCRAKYPTAADFDRYNRLISVNLAVSTGSIARGITDWLLVKKSSIRHECSHSAILRSGIVPSRVLELAMRIDDGTFALAEGMGELEGRLTAAELDARVGTSAHHFFSFHSLVFLAPYQMREEIVADIDASFTLLTGRPLSAQLKVALSSLIDDLQSGALGIEAANSKAAALFKDLYRELRSNVGFFHFAQMRRRVYLANQLIEAFDEGLAYHLDGKEIDYDAYSELFPGAAEAVKEMVGHWDQYLRRPQIYQSFLAKTKLRLPQGTSGRPQDRRRR